MDPISYPLSVEAESGNIVCSCVINTEFVIWISRQRLLTDYASLKFDSKQSHIINDIFLSWHLWHCVKHKFDENRVIWALFFLICYIFSKITGQKKYGGVGEEAGDKF